MRQPHSTYDRFLKQNRVGWARLATGAAKRTSHLKHVIRWAWAVSRASGLKHDPVMKHEKLVMASPMMHSSRFGVEMKPRHDRRLLEVLARVRGQSSLACPWRLKRARERPGHCPVKHDHFPSK